MHLFACTLPAGVEEKTKEGEEYDMHSPEIPRVYRVYEETVKMEERADGANDVDNPLSEFSKLPCPDQLRILYFAEVQSLFFCHDIPAFFLFFLDLILRSQLFGKLEAYLFVVFYCARMKRDR